MTEEALAARAERILRGECCGNCAHAGNLTHAGTRLARTVSCEHHRACKTLVTEKGSSGYWHERDDRCECYARRRE